MNDATPERHDLVDLDAHRWNHRLLLLFAPDAADARYRKQLERLEPHAAALAERDLRVVHLLAHGPHPVPQRPTDLAGAAADAARLRSSFAGADAGADEGAFRAVLVGKDGGAKERWSEPVDPEAVFALIDGMPMRRRELRERGGA